MNNEHLVITNVSIEFPAPGGAFKALDDVNLKIQAGEFISLIGHSGCGKSTVLNIVAGLYQATTGGVILNGREVDEPGPDRAVVFQNHSLLPWLTAYENVELAVKQVFKGRKSKKEMAEWIQHNLELVHMGHAMHKRPNEISGGMKQRVGIARALSMEPEVLLMDEPFGALDALTRAHMQDSLLEIQARLNNTVIMITHDVDEAVLLSDRIVMMTNGPAATIGEILDVDLPRPRHRLELADDPTYNHYRAEVVRFLHERHAHPGSVKSAAAPTAAEEIEKPQLKLGYIPLTDCAPLVVAKEKGFFEKYGLDVTLSREPSWANIRDKVAIGELDGAQMLCAMVVASHVYPEQIPFVTALSLDLNGNAITVSNELYEKLNAVPDLVLTRAMDSARALKLVVDEHNSRSTEPLTFAVVYPESSHNYLLRYWMASAGIDPDRDINLIVVPPAQMVNYLRAGRIAGYCVGEPWNSQAVRDGVGHIVATTYDIWNNHPEKVLGVTRQWSESHPVTHRQLIKAIVEACQWLDQPDHRREACDLLSRDEYVNTSADVLRMSLAGTIQFSNDRAAQICPDFNVFYRNMANYPWQSHAQWVLTQMLRWGQVQSPVDMDQLAQAVYMPDIYRNAVTELDIQVPTVDFKVEGVHSQTWDMDGITMGPDLFMDGGKFDQQHLLEYVRQFDMHHSDMDLDKVRRSDQSEDKTKRVV